jgi:hypothetical protein
MLGSCWGEDVCQLQHCCSGDLPCRPCLVCNPLCSLIPQTLCPPCNSNSNSNSRAQLDSGEGGGGEEGLCAHCSWFSKHLERFQQELMMCCRASHALATARHKPTGSWQGRGGKEGVCAQCGWSSNHVNAFSRVCDVLQRHQMQQQQQQLQQDTITPTVGKGGRGTVRRTRLAQQSWATDGNGWQTIYGLQCVFTLSSSTRSTSPGTSLGLPLGVSSALGRIMAPTAA